MQFTRLSAIFAVIHPLRKHCYLLVNFFSLYKLFGLKRKGWHGLQVRLSMCEAVSVVHEVLWPSTVMTCDPALWWPVVGGDDEDSLLERQLEGAMEEGHQALAPVNRWVLIATLLMLDYFHSQVSLINCTEYRISIHWFGLKCNIAQITLIWR